MSFVDSFLGPEPKSALLSFGFVLLLFFASNGMIGLCATFNKNYIASRSHWPGKDDDGHQAHVADMDAVCLPAPAHYAATCSNGWVSKMYGVLKSILVLRWVLIVTLFFTSSLLSINIPGRKMR